MAKRIDRTINDSSIPSNFLVSIRLWLGRIIKTIINFPYKLRESSKKTNQVAQAPLKEASQTSTSKPKHSDVATTSSLSVKDRVSLPGNTDNLSPDSIINIVFSNVNKKKSLFEEAKFYQLDGTEVKKIDLKNLSGSYHVQWKNGNGILIYKGEFSKGKFDGTGTIFSQDYDGSLDIILEGQFHNGEFVKGLFKTEEGYIDATFNNGIKNGHGTIYESGAPIYRGEFINSVAYGEGIFFENEIIKKGTFKNGKLIEGFSKIDNFIYNGSWTGNKFNGTVKNITTGSVYKGECLNDLYHGSGEKVSQETYDLQVINSEKEIEVRSNEGRIKIHQKGIFKNDELDTGEEITTWLDNNGVDSSKKKIVKLDKGIVQSEDNYLIIKGQTFTLRGNIDLNYSGKGQMFNADNALVYEGELLLGFPHGQGTSYTSDQEQTGWFEFSKFVGTNKPLSDHSASLTDDSEVGSKAD